MSYSYGSTIVESYKHAVHLAVEEYFYAGGGNSPVEIASCDIHEAAKDFLRDIPEIEIRPIPYIDDETTPPVEIDTSDYDIESMVKIVAEECKAE